MEYHPAVLVFPEMDAVAYAALREDIRVNGQISPIVTLQGKILDGRHRERICRELDIEPKTHEYAGNDPVGFVLSANLHRRHLVDAQRALVAARLANLGEGRPPGKTVDLSTVSVTLPEAAERLNVSRCIVSMAKQVLERGAPELVKAVDDGRLGVRPAYEIARKLPPERHHAAVAAKLEPKPVATREPKPEDAQGVAPHPLGVGTLRAQEAINCLKKIPSKDPDRKLAFQLVINFIKGNP